MSTHAVSADGRGIARSYDERLSEADGILGKYILHGDADRPHFEMLVESRAASLVADFGGDQDRAEYAVRNALKARCTNESTMFPAVEVEKNGKRFTPVQHVYLDVDGLVAAQSNRSFALDCPSVLFGSLQPEDSMYEAGKREGMAVYFDPSQKGKEDREPRIIFWDGQAHEVASDWDPACYQGVIRFFPSFQAMKEARRDLVRALKVLSTPPETDAEEEEPPPPDEPDFAAHAL